MSFKSLRSAIIVVPGGILEVTVIPLVRYRTDKFKQKLYGRNMDTHLCPRCNAELGKPYAGSNKWFAKCPQCGAVIRVTSLILRPAREPYYVVVPGQEEKAAR